MVSRRGALPGRPGGRMAAAMCAAAVFSAGNSADAFVLHKTASAGPPVFYTDGYSRVGCDNDATPHKHLFSENACGGLNKAGLPKSCAFGARKMTVDTCFQFCRTQGNQYRFFGISAGSKCYCTEYYVKSAKGASEGKCDAPCDGNNKEVCGGADKASLFEMHSCKNSVAQFRVAQTVSAAQRAMFAEGLEREVGTFVTLVKDMSTKWDLTGICSASKFGLCDYGHRWLDDSNAANAFVIHAKKDLKDYDEAAAAAKGLDEGDLPALEAATVKLTEMGTGFLSSVREGYSLYYAMNEQVHTPDLPSVGDLMNMAASSSGGAPSVGGAAAPASDWRKADEHFKPAGRAEAKWGSLCDLGKLGDRAAFFVTDFGGLDREACSYHCLGDDKCMGYNYASFHKNARSCTFLTSEGINKDNSIIANIPIFEISQSRVEDIGFDEIRCMLKGTTLAGTTAGRGPANTAVVKKLEIGGAS